MQLWRKKLSWRIRFWYWMSRYLTCKINLSCQGRVKFNWRRNLKKRTFARSRSWNWDWRSCRISRSQKRWGSSKHKLKSCKTKATENRFSLITKSKRTKRSSANYQGSRSNLPKNCKKARIQKLCSSRVRSRTKSQKTKSFMSRSRTWDWPMPNFKSILTQK